MRTNIHGSLIVVWEIILLDTWVSLRISEDTQIKMSLWIDLKKKLKQLERKSFVLRGTRCSNKFSFE
jgi:hypothetical protein